MHLWKLLGHNATESVPSILSMSRKNHFLIPAPWGWWWLIFYVRNEACKQCAQTLSWYTDRFPFQNEEWNTTWSQGTEFTECPRTISSCSKEEDHNAHPRAKNQVYQCCRPSFPLSMARSIEVGIRKGFAHSSYQDMASEELCPPSRETAK